MWKTIDLRALVVAIGVVVGGIVLLVQGDTTGGIALLTSGALQSFTGPVIRRGDGAPPTAALLVLLLPALVGCGASAIGAQADTLAVSAAIVAEADEIVVTVRARDLDEVTRAAQAECPATGCDPARVEHYRRELADRVVERANRGLLSSE